MRKRLKLAAVPLTLVLGLALSQGTVAATVDSEGKPGLVDFRMAPLEQVKKISLHLRAREGVTETLTVMRWNGEGDGRHLILGRSDATRADLNVRLRDRRFDSVSWFRRGSGGFKIAGTCDSDDECEKKTDEMCDQAGHDGVNVTTVQITVHADGSKTCSGDCNSNGAVAFVTCSPN